MGTKERIDTIYERVVGMGTNERIDKGSMNGNQ